LIFAVTALADAPDVTNTANYSNLGFAPDHTSLVSVTYNAGGFGGQGTTTVTVRGGWAWPTHGKDCNTDRAGAGFAIDWNDSTDAGYALGKTGISVGSQNPHGFSLNTDANVVQPTPSAADPGNSGAVKKVSSPSDFANWGGGCGKVSTGTVTGGGKGAGATSFSQGIWGPISHTYVGSPADLPSQICAVTYDVHAGVAADRSGTGFGTPGNAKEITSGGNGYNGDNSVESNGQTPAGNVCAAIKIPASPPPVVDLSITKVGSPNPVTEGHNITWTIVVTNHGPGTDTGVTVTDPIPAGTTFVSVSTTQGSCAGGAVISCSLGTMAAGASVTITLVTTANQTGTLVNNVTVTGNAPESNTNNNTATAPVVVKGFTPPLVFCTAVSRVAPKQLFVGRKTTLTIHVTRHGKAVRGVHVRIRGPHLLIRTKASSSKGVIKQQVRVRKAGALIFTPLASKRCGTKRLGVTGVFTPPVTG
jgi:uncharacterized repeat protein (TIGR01451 family)